VQVPPLWPAAAAVGFQRVAGFDVAAYVQRAGGCLVWRGCSADGAPLLRINGRLQAGGQWLASGAQGWRLQLLSVQRQLWLHCPLGAERSAG
jgi:hypothetical protein